MRESVAVQFLVPTRKTISERWTKGTCLSLHLAVVCCAGVAAFLLPSSVAMILSGVMVALAFGFLAYVEGKREPFWLNPLSVYLAWNVFGLGISAVYVGSLVVSETSMYFSGLSFISDSDLVSGYLICLLGSLFLHVGLQLARPKPASSENPPSEKKAAGILLALFVMWFICTAQLAAPRYFLALGSPGTIFAVSGHAALTIFALFPPRFFRLSEFTHRALLSIGAAILFIASLGSNSKLASMLTIIPLVCYVTVRPKLHRYVPLISGILLFLYLTVVAPTINISRVLEIRPGETRVDAEIEAFKRFSPLATGKFDADFYASQADDLLKRQFEPISVAFIFGEVQRRGFLYGETLESIPISLIPRILWPEKPRVMKGAWFAVYTGGSISEEESNLSVGMEAAGELYWNFGLPGVFVGMVLLGSMFGGLWRMAGYDTRANPAHHWLHMSISLGMVNLPEASSRYVSCVALFFIFGSMFVFLDYQKKKSLRVPIVKF
jgi:hypothetical protein